MSIFKRLICYKLIVKLLLLSIFPVDVFAQTRVVFDTTGNIQGSFAETYNPKQNLSNINNIRMQASISGATQKALANRGYTAADPRVSATIFNMGNAGKAIAVVAGGAAAVAVGTVTAPAWGSILVTAAVSSVVFSAVSLAITAGWNWLFGSDNSVTTQQITNIYQAPPMQQGQAYWDCFGGYRGASAQVIHTCFEHYKNLSSSREGWKLDIDSCKLVSSGSMYTCTVRNAQNQVQWHSPKSVDK